MASCSGDKKTALRVIIIPKFAEPNPETLDIFEPAMHNLFDTSGIVIDKILEGEL